MNNSSYLLDVTDIVALPFLLLYLSLHESFCALVQMSNVDVNQGVKEYTDSNINKQKIKEKFLTKCKMRSPVELILPS